MSDSNHVWEIDSFLDPILCHKLLESVQSYREKVPLPEIYRPLRGRSLHYFVINGKQVAESFPELQPLYSQIKLLAEKGSELPLQFMKHQMVGININITPPGGEYRWHYDRNAVTAILFLNEVEGGETEIYPAYRIKLKNKKHTKLQKMLDGFLMNPWIRRWAGRKFAIRPQTGKLLFMRGDKCLHSVRAVLGDRDRINLIFSFEIPGEINPQEEILNDYLYTKQSVGKSDPNYLP